MTRAKSKKSKRGESFRAKKARIARQQEKRRQIQAGKLLRPIVEEICTSQTCDGCENCDTGGREGTD